MKNQYKINYFNNIGNFKKKKEQQRNVYKLCITHMYIKMYFI